MAEPPAPGLLLRGHPLLRRGSGWALVGVVSVLHLLAVNQVASETLGWGQRDHDVPRIEVAFVRELQQAAPPAVAPVAAPAPAPKPERALPLVAQRPKDAASVPAARASAATEPPATEPVVVAASPPAPSPPPPPAPAPAPAPATNVDPAPPVAAAASEPAPPTSAPVSASATPAASFDWPPSTQLSYQLLGQYSGGPIDGKALVEWRRSGDRYQVVFDFTAATFISRRSVSDGELTARGLEPRQFNGEQRNLFRTRRWSHKFSPDRITLGDGTEQPTAPGVQDEASQFVQLTWLFTTQPSLLQVGRSIEVPLILNRRLDHWVYEVVEQETLRLPFGEVPTFHVKPRRSRPDVYAVEMWFAPSLQYLPVRIVVRLNENNHADLTLKNPPLQAAADPATR